MASRYDIGPILTEYLFRIWYRMVNKFDRKGEVVFMNYGYCNGKTTTDLHPDQEENRTCIQLYDQLVEGVDLKGKQVLEVGSGRGGGLSFLTKKYQPIMATGIDLDRTAVSFCNKSHGSSSLKFVHGNAENLPIEDNSIDVIINVESSHRYENMKAFLSEVKRVLRPGGSFLITDFRHNDNIEKFYREINNSGLNKIFDVLITPQVVQALTQDDHRRRQLVSRLVPWGLRRTALDFAGVIGSNTYESFAAGKWTYFNYHFTKDH